MTGINQSLILTGTKGITARVTVQETYDIYANTSDIQVGVEIASEIYGGHLYYLLGSVAAEGQTLQSMSAYAGTHFVYLERTGTYYPIAAGDSKHTGSPWSLAGIRHEDDGSKTLTLDLRLTGEEENGSGADDWEIRETVEVLLTRIPRASTIAATDAVVGGVSVVAVNRKSEQYTHSVAYQFGSLTGYLTEDGTSSQEEKLYPAGIAFTLPESFYSQLLTAKSGVCTLLCKTYWGETQIGDTQSCTFTVGTDPGVCAPEVSGRVTDGNPDTVALTGDAKTLVRYVSEAVCVIGVNPRKNARVAEKRINEAVVTADSRTIEAIEQDTVTFFAKDSRGYTGEAVVKTPMIPYVRLSCHPEVKRTDPTSGKAVLSVRGDCFFGSFGAVSNQLQLRYRIGNGAWNTMPFQQEANSYTAQAELTGLAYTSSYPVEVQAWDKLLSANQTIVLGKGIPVFDWGENDFSFHVPVRLAGLPQKDNEAASKAYADKKLSLVKLWQNPDTTADFPAQTVEVDLSGCDFVFCAAVSKAGAAEYQLSSLIANQIGNAGQIHSLHCDEKDFWLNWRRFTVAFNGIRFDGACMRDMGSGSVFHNWLARSVPVAIYGVKGMGN